MKRNELKKEEKRKEEAKNKKATVKKTKIGRTIEKEAEKKLRVLILEDNTADAELMERQLRRDKIACTTLRTQTRSEFKKALKEFGPDVILADYTMPKFDALHALKLARETFPFLPFIVVTGTIGEEKAVACLRLGADDYLLKDRLARLGEALRQAVASRRLQAERMVIEASMERAAQRWRTTFDAMNDAVCLLDEAGAVLQCNRAMNRLLRLPFKQIIGRNCLEMICGSGKQATCAFHLARKDGRRHEEESFWRGSWYLVRVDPISGVDGEFAGAVHIMTDITAARSAEYRLRESAAKLSRAQRVGRLGNWDWDIVGNTLEWSDELYRIWGVDKDFPLTSDRIAAMIHPKDQASNQAMIQQLLSERDEGEFEFRIICPDGTVKHIHQHIHVTRAPSGQAVRMFGIMQDITSRMQSEEALRHAERKFRELAESLPQAVFETDLDGVLTYANPVAFDMFGYDSSEFSAGLNIMQMLAPANGERAKQNIRQVFAGERQTGNEYLARRKDGSSFPILLYSVAIVKDSRPTGLRGILIDITERKHTEERIAASLAEKEVLLKEIHHRVKNNLQIISSLLSLQMEKIDDPRLLQVLRESQSRIWTMSLIHQRLYQSGNLGDIDMADYIPSLSGTLLSNFAQSATPPTVHFDLIPLRLVIDRAIPLALIFNELLTNALKHAFPDDRPGVIRISLQRAPAPAVDTFDLTIADNGAGLPSGFDQSRQKSLGLHLVAMLARQLGGALAIEQADGTLFRITFPGHEKDKSES